MCCSGLCALPLNVKAVSINVVFLDESVSELLDCNAFLVGTLDHLIIDICEVLNECNIVA